MWVKTVPLALLGALVVACGGSQDKPDNSAWQTREGFRSLGVDENGEIDTSKSLGFHGFDWLGVRHDLILNPDKPQKPTCACLSVEVGNPSDDKFVWRGVKPDNMNPANVAVAVSAFGVDCPGGAPNPADRRPSIQAIDRAGKDVVIVIEELPPDRPIATGAIMRPPDQGGHIYVRPRTKVLPYGRTGTKELCRVR
ncbi:MAG: hypothetical protein HOW73_36490 [Polyangiaceae bacterium]|nr:hypothetical protein [Polyangiaceae bacterium]